MKKAHYLNLIGKPARLIIGRGHYIEVKPGINHLPVKVYEMHPNVLQPIDDRAVQKKKPSFRQKSEKVVEQKVETTVTEPKEESATVDVDRTDKKAIREYLRQFGVTVAGNPSLENMNLRLDEFLESQKGE